MKEYINYGETQRASTTLVQYLVCQFELEVQGAPSKELAKLATTGINTQQQLVGDSGRKNLSATTALSITSTADMFSVRIERSPKATKGTMSDAHQTNEIKVRKR